MMKLILKALRKLGKWIYTFIRAYHLLAIGMLFAWGVPIYLLSEVIFVAGHIPAHFKIGVGGIGALIVAFFAFRSRIKTRIARLPDGAKHAVLNALHKLVPVALFLGIFWGLSLYANKLFDWWLVSSCSIAIGNIFYIADEISSVKRKKEREEAKHGNKEI